MSKKFNILQRSMTNEEIKLPKARKYFDFEAQKKKHVRTVFINFRVTENQHKFIETEAKQMGLELSSLLRHMIHQYKITKYGMDE